MKNHIALNRFVVLSALLAASAVGLSVFWADGVFRFAHLADTYGQYGKTESGAPTLPR